jgi:hypothetical protein
MAQFSKQPLRYDPYKNFMLIRLLDKSLMSCYSHKYGPTRIPDFPSRVSAGVSR